MSAKARKSVCVVVRNASGPCAVCKDQADPVHCPLSDPIRLLCAKCCPCQAQPVTVVYAEAGQ
jgi:hypothetical protein